MNNLELERIHAEGQAGGFGLGGNKAEAHQKLNALTSGITLNSIAEYITPIREYQLICRVFMAQPARLAQRRRHPPDLRLQCC